MRAPQLVLLASFTVAMTIDATALAGQSIAYLATSRAQENGQSTDASMRRPPNSPKDFVSQRIKSMPDFPYLPKYTGRDPKFTGAFSFPNYKNGQSYAAQLLCQEDPDTVKNWYRQVFQSSGWTINEKMTTNNSMTAARPKDGIYCTVMIDAAPASQYRTSLTIRYLNRGPLDIPNQD